MSDEEETNLLTRQERLKLFWEAPEFEQARRFAGDPEEYSYEDIEDCMLDEARVPKYKGVPVPLPEREPTKPVTDLSLIQQPDQWVEIDDRPAAQTRVIEETDQRIKGTTLLDAHRDVLWNLNQLERRGEEPLQFIRHCLHVADQFDIYHKINPPEFVDFPLPESNDPTVTVQQKTLELMTRLHHRGWKTEVLSDFRTPEGDDRNYRLRLHLRVTQGDYLSAPHWGGKITGSAEILDTIDKAETVEEYERFWTLIDRYTVRGADIQKTVELVGDLSEGLDYISYNEEGIRDAWANNRLNEEVQWDKTNDPAKYQRFIDLIGKDAPADDDYDAMLTALIIKINGWPAKYSNDPNDLEDLTIQEQLKLLPYQLDIAGSRQCALNYYVDLRKELEKRLPTNATGTE